jgi:hypothetical protein
MRDRGVRPVELWAGILAGPIAFAFVLTIKYAAAQWACMQAHRGVLELVNLAGLVVTLIGGAIAWRALARTPASAPTDGDEPLGIARFMAISGIASSALFAVVTIANGVPQWVLDACR